MESPRPRAAARAAAIALIATAAAAAAARAEPEDVPGPPRTPTTSLATMFRGPFQSARLFMMPAADVVGAYQLSLSGDASLLAKPGLLTAAGVIALGFGDLAQLEYRHTEAIGLTGLDAPVPAVGVQLKLPLPARPGVPAIGVAFRLGVPRSELFEGLAIDEKVTDLYLVGRLRVPGASWLVLHGGARVSFATAVPADASAPAIAHTLWLPAAGLELVMNPTTHLVGEAQLAPQFQWDADPARRAIRHAMVGRLGVRWRVLPAIVIDGSLGLQVDDAQPGARFDAVASWDIRLGAELAVPWGAIACRAVGAFCDDAAPTPNPDPPRTTEPNGDPR